MDSPCEGSTPRVYSEKIVDYAGRPAGAPMLYEAFNHPKAPMDAKRVLFFYMDTTPEAMHKMLLYEKAQHIPFEHTGELSTLGYVQLEDKHYLFAACHRLNMDRRRPELDAIKLWVTTAESISDKAKEDLAESVDLIHGPAELRDVGHANTEVKGVYTGATHIQRSCRMVSDTMAYTFGPSHERQAGIVGPPKSGKLKDANCPPDDHLLARKSIITSAVAVAMESLQRGPPDVIAALRMLSDLVNTWRLGNSDTFCFTTTQTNFSDPRLATDRGPQEDLGFFGFNHADTGDHPCAFTNTLSVGKLSIRTHPGWMILMTPLVYVRLDYLTALNFSGRGHHGAIGAHALELEAIGLDKRVLEVFYPQRVALDAECRYSLFTMPDNIGVFYSTPETRFPERHMDRIGVGTRSTFARDGQSMADVKSTVTFMVRELYTVFNYALLQMPNIFEIQINADMVMNAVSFRNEGGKRLRVGVWPNAPGFRPEGASRDLDQVDVEAEELVDQGPIRLAVFQDLKKKLSILEKLTPHAVSGRKGKPMSDEDVEAILEDYLPSSSVTGDFNALSYANREKNGETNLQNVNDHNARYKARSKTVSADPGSSDDEDDGWVDLDDFSDKEEEDFIENEDYRELVKEKENNRFAEEREAKRVLNKKKRELAKARRDKENSRTRSQRRSTTSKGESQQPKGKGRGGKSQNKRSTTSRISLNGAGVDRSRAAAAGGLNGVPLTLDRVTDPSDVEFEVDLPGSSSTIGARQQTVARLHRSVPEEPLLRFEIPSPSTLEESYPRVDAARGVASARAGFAPSTSGSTLSMPNPFSTEAAHSTSVSNQLVTRMNIRHLGSRAMDKLATTAVPRTEVAAKRKDKPVESGEGRRQSKRLKQLFNPSGAPTDDPRSHSGYSFLTRLNISALLGDLRIVERVVAFERNIVNNLGVSIAEIQTAGTDIDRPDLSSVECVLILSRLNQAAVRVEESVITHSVLVKMGRYYVLLARAEFARWLYQTLPRICSSLLRMAAVDVPSNDRGLHKLLLSISVFVSNRGGAKTMTSHDFGFNMESDPFSHTIYSGSKYLVSQTEIEEKTVLLTQEVITSWSHGLVMSEHWRLYFLLALRDSLPVAALALDCVWELYNTLTRTEVLKSGARKIHPSLDDIAPLAHALRSHPCANPASLDARIIQQIFSLSHHFASGIPINKSAVPFQMWTTLDTDPDIPLNLWDGPSRFRRYILQCFALITFDDPPLNLSPLQLYVLESPNKRLPFREHLPLRLKMGSDEGPYTFERIRSTSGMFSSLIWRGLTIDSPFAIDGPSYFPDLEAFETATVGIQASDICPLIARRVPNCRRTPDLAETYWSSALEMHWEEYIQGLDASFMETYGKFYSQHARERPFPHLGSLGALEAAADIAYAGCYPLPSLIEIAVCMSHNNSRSTRGLETFLGLDTASEMAVGDLRLGLEKVSSFVEAITSESQRSHMAYDFVMLEHALCKFQGAVKDGYA